MSTLQLRFEPHVFVDKWKTEPSENYPKQSTMIVEKRFDESQRSMFY